MRRIFGAAGTTECVFDVRMDAVFAGNERS